MSDTVATAIARLEPMSLEPARSPTVGLVQLALERGADPATLERLMALHERWEAGEARKAYTCAMAAFKSECPPVLRKDATVKYGTTSYRHATLGGIVDEITPYLSRHGLSVSWRHAQTNGEVTVVCRATHVLGHSEETSLTGPPDASGQKNKIQQLGSSVTYLERYTLLSLLGLSTAEMDDDGQAAGKRPEEPPPPDPGPAPRGEAARPASTPKTNGGSQTKGSRAKAAVAAYAALGVLQEDLETWLGATTGAPPLPVEQWTDADLEDLTTRYKELKKLAGPARQKRVREIFGLSSSAVEG